MTPEQITAEIARRAECMLRRIAEVPAQQRQDESFEGSWQYELIRINKMLHLGHYGHVHYVKHNYKDNYCVYEARGGDDHVIWSVDLSRPDQVGIREMVRIKFATLLGLYKLPESIVWELLINHKEK